MILSDFKYFGILKGFDFSNIDKDNLPVLISTGLFDEYELSSVYKHKPIEKNDIKYFGVELFEKTTSPSLRTLMMSLCVKCNFFNVLASFSGRTITRSKKLFLIRLDGNQEQPRFWKKINTKTNPIEKPIP